MITENKRNWNTIVIGGGQAGLATGYYLKYAQDDFVILCADERTGDSWRNRWNSLKLFTPNWANALPGYPFPGKKNSHAGKDEVADFLELYATHFGLPVLRGTNVTMLEKQANNYLVTTNCGTFTANHIIVASGGYNKPKLPVFAGELAADVFQLHSSAYRKAVDLQAGDILVVGAGTSGVQIAIDVATPERKVFLAGTPPLKIPGFILKYFGRQFIWAMNNIMTIKTKPGRKAEYALKSKHAAAPLINTGIKEAIAAGVQRVSRVSSVLDGYPVLADGTILKVSNVIFCTGYSNDFTWIKLNDIIDGNGYPFANRGVSNTHKGLYFVGMTFQYALTSSWINGVGRDAKYIVDHIHKSKAGKNKSSFFSL